ncbi:MAG: peptidase M15, partial [Pseudomonadota bacterium]|nr:peptidase M15 [Pseudomonadota bacterium]
MMRNKLQGLLSLFIIPVMMVGCTSSSTKMNQNQGKRIYIPQEQVTFTRPIPNKVEPASYRKWLGQGENYARVREYEQFLMRNNVAHIIPSFELLRSARDWQKCGRSEYMVPPLLAEVLRLRDFASARFVSAARCSIKYEVTAANRPTPST